MAVAKVIRKLDTLLSPPPNYANFTYRDRLKSLTTKLLTWSPPFRTAIELVRVGLMVAASYALYPVAYMLKARGYRFCNIDLAQIGSVIYLDLFLRENALTSKTSRNKILVLASTHTDGNRYLLDLYNSHVTFIRNPVLKFILSPFFVSNLFQDNSFKYDLTFHTETIAHKIWNNYAEEKRKPLILFPKNDAKKARKLLEKYIPKNKKFVALHVRDNGFYNASSQTTRNANIFTYEKAVEYLIDKGYAVIRLGDNRMVDITPMKERCGSMLFDYAYSDIRSEMMDCFLLSHCDFFIGLASGPASVPMLFDVGSCNVNWYNASNAPNFIPGDITTFKKFRYKRDDTLVPFETILQSPYKHNPRQETLDLLGVYFEDNTEQEILDTVREYLETPLYQQTRLQKLAQSKLSDTNYAYGANGTFSDTILKLYFT
ncbi:MAG: TIGR04372 family glycosyltransferase [Methyloligellaceae bacterium]